MIGYSKTAVRKHRGFICIKKTTGTAGGSKKL